VCRMATSKTVVQFDGTVDRTELHPSFLRAFAGAAGEKKVSMQEVPSLRDDRGENLFHFGRESLSIGRTYTIERMLLYLNRKYCWLLCPIIPLLYDIIRI
jgi:hypothetical protein